LISLGVKLRSGI